MQYLQWLQKQKDFISCEGKKIEVFSLLHNSQMNNIMSEWATHFRNQYCNDSIIDRLKPPSKSRKDYLNEIKFPDKSITPGPSIRAGDFGEILIADFLEYIENYWVPRTRYNDKNIRNESTKGSDIIGFKFINSDSFSPHDKLCIFESKSGFSSNNTNFDRLQNAVDDSIKDEKRKAESLNAIKQRFIDIQDFKSANRIERFQEEEDNPYIQEYGAAAIFDDNVFLPTKIIAVDCSKHPFRDILRLIVITGNDMMTLVHHLYERAANEA